MDAVFSFCDFQDFIQLAIFYPYSFIAYGAFGYSLNRTFFGYYASVYGVRIYFCVFFFYYYFSYMCYVVDVYYRLI